MQSFPPHPTPRLRPSSPLPGKEAQRPPEHGDSQTPGMGFCLLLKSACPKRGVGHGGGPGPLRGRCPSSQGLDQHPSQQVDPAGKGGSRAGAEAGEEKGRRPRQKEGK